MFDSSVSFGTLDGQDFMTYWGLGVENGSDSFRAFNQPKPGYSYNWQDQNGTEFDLISPVKKEARIFSLNLWLLASSVTEFNTKFTQLENKLFSAGYRTIYCKKYNVTVKAKINSFPKNIEAPVGVPFLGTTFFGVQFSIDFIECLNV